MNAIPMLNAALHALLLSAAGWLLVRWCVRDARHRAWSSLLVLLVAIVAPLFMETRTETPALVRHVVAEAPAPVVSTWKPDWKIPTTALEPVRVSVPIMPESPPAPRWTVADAVGWAGALWIAGSIAMALWHSVMSLLAWRWRTGLRELSDAEREVVPAQASLFDLRVFNSSGCPCVLGLWRPVIAVPQHSIGTWTSRQWTWLLRHEGAHVRGRDTLVVWLLGWVKALLWWNPFVHALVEQWSQAREEICDRAAVTEPQDSTAYWSFLLDVAAGTRAASPALLHMAASRPARRLRARLTAMLALRDVREGTSPWFMLGTSVVMSSLTAIVSCVGLKAQDAPALTTGVMKTRAFKVAPDFLGAGHVNARELFTALGIPFPEGSSASFNRAASQLIVTNTVENLDRVDAELAALKAGREATHAQVHITSRWIEMDDPFPQGDAQEMMMSLLPEGAESSIFTDAQYQVILRFLSQRLRLDMLGAPSVTTRFGQRAVVEVIREVPGTERAHAAELSQPPPVPDFVGVSQGVLVNAADEKLELEVNADMGDFADPELRGWRTKEGFKVPAHAAVVHLQKKHTTTLPDGHTLMLRVGKSPVHPGRTVLLFVTPKVINPAGQAVPAESARERAVRERALREKADRLISHALTMRKAADELIKAGSKVEAHKKLLTAFQSSGSAASIYPMWKAGLVSGQLKEIEQSIVSLGFPAPQRAIAEPKPPAGEGTVLIDVKWIDLPSGPLPELKFADPAADRLLRSIDLNAIVRPMDQYGVVPMGIFAVTAAFTKEQFAALLPAILAHKGVTLTSAPPVKAESGEKTDIKQEGVDDFKVSLEAHVGPDGHTIDLFTELPNSLAHAARNIRTAVTIWSGQTVALGGTVPDNKNGEKRRIVFITAKLKKDPPKLQPR